MLPLPQTYATWIAALRIYTGAFWLMHGLRKVVVGGYLGPKEAHTMAPIPALKAVTWACALLVVGVAVSSLWYGDASAQTQSVQTQSVGEAYIVPLFPQKEADLMKGIPPGMTAYSFWAAHGTARLTKEPDSKVVTEFTFDGLIPYGVYTLWNVLETQPFKDEPYTEFGAGKHSIVADGQGHAHKIVVRSSWPGKEFLLDYHADGKLSQASGVYPGALWGKLPPEPQR